MVCYLAFSGTLYAEVSQFVFVNEVRTVAPGVLSEPLTIQSQNSTGTQESILETTDLVLQSSSPTGEFLNSSGNPVSTTMSKNTANRTFYYRDSATGIHTLTVTATGRDTQKTFKTTQSINVGNSNQLSTSETGQQSTTTSVTTTNNDGAVSSHSNPSPASDSKSILNFEVSAGRKRFTSVASEVVFKAEPLKLSGIPENYIQYVWSFGDGTVAHGQIVNHRYRFAGDYVVILNATYSDKSAVSRTHVSVISPTISLAVVNGGVQVLNNSSGEINIGEWIVDSSRNRLELPRDTIIEKGKIVTFAYDGVVATDKVMLKNPLGVIVAETISTIPVIQPEVEINKELKNNIVESSKPVVKIVYVERPVIKKEVVATTTEVQQQTEQVIQNNVEADSLVANMYVGSEKTSALESFLWIPKKGWGLLSGLFR